MSMSVIGQMMLLMRHLDVRHVPRPINWDMAIRLSAIASIEGERFSFRKLADNVGVSRSVLRARMKTDAWKSDLANDIEGLKHGMRKIVVRPLTIGRS